MKDYVSMLEELYRNMPKRKDHEERFKIPSVEVVFEGKNRVIIRNFGKIVDILRRDIREVAKYFSKELGAPTQIDKDRLIIQRRVLPKLIQNKLEFYINEYVLCKECKRPDTVIISVEGVKILRCEACGARRYLK